jgi:hypothetical protein
MTIVNIQFKVSHFLPDGSMNTSSGLGSSCVQILSTNMENGSTDYRNKIDVDHIFSC